MENNSPFSPVRSISWIVLTILCIGLFTTACQTTAKTTPTPIIAITGENEPSETPQETATSTKVYIPLVMSTPTPVVDTGTPLGNGKVYYVATTGSDSNSGTKDRPWKTLKKGVSVLKAGDTLYIMSGTYVQTGPLVVSASGNTSNGPITITTAPGERGMAIITGDANQDGQADAPSDVYSAIVELRGSYLHLRNVSVVYSKGRGIKSGGKFNVMSGNDVHHIWNSGIYIYGPDNLVEGNSVWRSADSNYCNGSVTRECNGNWPGALSWGASHDSQVPGVAPRIIIRNNKVFHNSGEGLLCMHTDYGLIEGNVVYDNWALNIDMDQCSYTTIQKNLVYGTPDESWFKGSERPSTGILLSNEGIKDSSGNTYPIGHDRKVINNIVVGSGASLYFWNGDGTGGGLPTSALKNDLIANNTFIAPGRALKIESGPHSNTRVINNVMITTGDTIGSYDSTSGITFANNLWSKAPPSSMSSSTDIIGNPLLVDPNHTLKAGEVLPEWYSLRSDSPAIGKGAHLAEVTVDFWSHSRPSKPDIGAHELP